MITPEYVPMRRSERAIEDESWIATFLQRAAFGVFAEVVDDQPTIHTNLFAYDPEEHTIIFHGTDKGNTYHNLQRNPPVAFTAPEMGRLIPNKLAREFTVEYESVTAYGHIRIVSDIKEQIAALNLLVAKYAPHLQAGVDYRLTDESQLPGTAVYKLQIERWSAKRRPPVDDRPGAYRFEDVRP